mmetsp:Transcript_340/g.500  ORF Transcript_340/g.500 Transcript_340/m.500 type:complete len:202 (+) Transcript_340:184-789(+)
MGDKRSLAVMQAIKQYPWLSHPLSSQIRVSCGDSRVPKNTCILDALNTVSYGVVGKKARVELSIRQLDKEANIRITPSSDPRSLPLSHSPVCPLSWVEREKRSDPISIKEDSVPIKLRIGAACYVEDNEGRVLLTRSLGGHPSCALFLVFLYFLVGMLNVAPLSSMQVCRSSAKKLASRNGRLHTSVPCVYGSLCTPYIST